MNNTGFELAAEVIGFQELVADDGPLSCVSRGPQLSLERVLVMLAFVAIPEEEAKGKAKPKPAKGKGCMKMCLFSFVGVCVCVCVCW